MRPFLTSLVISIAVASTLATLSFPLPGVAQDSSSPTTLEGETAPSAPSPVPVPPLSSVIRPGATYLGTTTTGAPLRIEVAADGSSIVWYEIGDTETLVQVQPTLRSILGSRRVGAFTVYESPAVIATRKSVPVMAWDQDCSALSQQANALWLKTGRDVPIVDGGFSDRREALLLEGKFDGDVVTGTFSASIRPGDLRCDVSTTWTARVVP